MEQKKESKMMVISTNPDFYQKVRVRAALKGLSISAYVREILEADIRAVDIPRQGNGIGYSGYRGVV